MPRANRHHLPHYVWHITHRCHRQQFLLRFARDRQAWIRWLYAARQRFGLCVLDYAVTSNHIHLLVRDRGRGEIARSIQLIAGRTAQAYNGRKDRHGAFWEDRYHATAVERRNTASKIIKPYRMETPVPVNPYECMPMPRRLTPIHANMTRMRLITAPAAKPFSFIKPAALA